MVNNKKFVDGCKLFHNCNVYWKFVFFYVQEFTVSNLMNMWLFIALPNPYAIFDTWIKYVIVLYD